MTSLFFTDDTVDRGVEARLDGDALRRLRNDAAARCLLVRRGRIKVKVESPMHIAWHREPELHAPDDDGREVVFLGRLDGRPCFAVVPAEIPLTANDRFTAGRGADGDGFVGLYEAAMALAPAEAQLAARAAHMANWVNRNRYCGACGARMRASESGYKRICMNEKCAREEFPRTDPVVITLVTRGNRCLLGRQPKFPPRRYAPIAGFVEPGETLEAAVRREVREEVGLNLSRLTYLGSQPWPYPASLMMGYIAEAAGDRFALEDGELEDARWFDRSEIAGLCAAAVDAQSATSLPVQGVIARQLIEEWMAGRR